MKTILIIEGLVLTKFLQYFNIQIHFKINYFSTSSVIDMNQNQNSSL